MDTNCAVCGKEFDGLTEIINYRRVDYCARCFTKTFFVQHCARALSDCVDSLNPCKGNCQLIIERC